MYEKIQNPLSLHVVKKNKQQIIKECEIVGKKNFYDELKNNNVISLISFKQPLKGIKKDTLFIGDTFLEPNKNKLYFTGFRKSPSNNSVVSLGFYFCDIGIFNERFIHQCKEIKKTELIELHYISFSVLSKEELPEFYSLKYIGNIFTDVHFFEQFKDGVKEDYSMHSEKYIVDELQDKNNISFIIEPLEEEERNVYKDIYSKPHNLLDIDYGYHKEALYQLFYKSD